MTARVRRLLRLLLGAGVAAAGVVVLAGPSHAAPKCPNPGIDQDINRADVVFRGEVAKVRPVRSAGGKKTRTYIVDADRVYKSSLATDRVAVTAPVGTRCALPALDQGTRYIFFVTEHKSRLLATSATAKATPRLTRQVVKRLGNGAQPQHPPPAAAEFTKVADAAPPDLSRLLAPGAALVILSLLGLLVLGRVGRRAA